MIEKSHITGLIANKINEINQSGLGKHFFVVDIHVGADNRISVFIDHEKQSVPVTIDDCADLSRWIESNLDRNIEDYELDISSAGLGTPLKVYKQFVKNKDEKVEVITRDGKKITGKLIAVSAMPGSPEDEKLVHEITLEIEKQVKVEGKKKKQTLVENLILNNTNIKTVKVVFDFSRSKKV